MTACAHHLSEGLAALVQLASRTDEQVSNGQMDAMDVVSERVWDSRWPAIRKKIVDSTTMAELERVLEEEAPAIWGDPLTEDDQDDLIDISVNAYHHGVVMGRREVKGRTTRRFTVARAKSPSATLQAKMAKPMTVRDRRAMEWLANDSMFWVGDQWNQGLGDQISGAAVKAFEKGERRGDLAAELGKSMAQYNKNDAYWRVVSSAAIVRGRSMGQISGFQSAGVTTIKFLSVGDERVSEICQAVHGTVFTIEQANDHVDRVTAAETPEQMKAAWPWTSADSVEGMDAGALAAAGVIAPPLHGRCRSFLVAEKFAPLADILGIEDLPSPPDFTPLDGSNQLGAPDVRPASEPVDASKKWTTGEPFDEDELGDQVSNLARRPKSKPWQSGVRKHVNTGLSSFGMSVGGSPAATGKGRLAIETGKLDGYDSAHFPSDSRIVVKPGLLKSAAKWIAAGAVARRAMQPEREATHDLFREHVASLESAADYQGAGVVLEDGTATLATDRVLADLFAPDQGEAREWMADSLTDHGTYSRYVEDLDAAFAAALEHAKAGAASEISPQARLSLLADAFIRMRQPGHPTKGTKAERAVGNLLRSIQLPAGYNRRRFTAELRRLLAALVPTP